MLPPTVAVVVVLRDRFSMFPRCIGALEARTAMPFRLVVVAGGADADTRRYLQELAARRLDVSLVLEDRLLTQADSRNRGLREVRERYCVVLENDTIVHANWLRPMLACLQEESAAVVTPLLWWYRGLHAAGGSFEESAGEGAVAFNHEIAYMEIRRRRVDYPENHCVLIDRRALPDDDLFDDVEPFDVDLGLMARRRGLTVFLEPRAEATYVAPPPIKLRDLPPFLLRWDWPTWEAANHRFARKWGVTYRRFTAKRASYRRQKIKMGLLVWWPSPLTVAVTNVLFGLTNRLQTLMAPKRIAPDTVPPSPAHAIK